MNNRMNGNQGGEDALAKRVIGLAIKVHNTLGCGFLESIYSNALEIELRGFVSCEDAIFQPRGGRGT